MQTQKQIKKLNFEGENIYVGIDTHKKDWRIALYHDDVALKTFSQEPRPELLIKYLNKNYPGANFHCAYEAGFCGFWIQKSLSKKGLNCIVVNPADVPTTHKEKEFKTDPRDCRKIARSLRSKLLEAIYIPTDEGLGSRSVVRLYNDMSRNYTRYKNKVKAILNFNGIEYPREFQGTNRHWSKRFYEWLKSLQLNTKEGTWTLQFYIDECLRAKTMKMQSHKQVREMSKTARFGRSVRLLMSIPGIGLITSMQLLTEIEDILRFKNLNQLCAYVGLVPTTNSSGEKDRVGDITKRGNKFLKGIIIEAAWSALRHDPVLLHAYGKLRKRMEGNHAVIRIARKLLSRILFVLVNEKPYEIRNYNIEINM